jgi:AmmeMemoRadiSam system radical SAM enzyme/AmmeMemoRadiSam system protein B/AmmeMemoRadiSam system protein A
MPRIVTLPPEGEAGAGGVKPGGWWQDSEDGRRILCGLCPRACALGPGDRGFCFVRENRDGEMVSTTYGRSTGFCIDPIEKKPLSHFYPGTAVLSFGTAGCNLGCKFCQNWSMSRSRDVDAACEVADPETIANAAAELNCRSVAFTYNDPIIFAEYAIDTAKACHAQGVQTVAVTSGYITPAARETFYAHMDAANIDLKSFSEEFYHKLTGGHLEPVLDSLRYVARETETHLEITNLIVPQANDSADEIRRMCDWIVEELGADVPLHFSAFHPDFKMIDRPATPLSTLLEAHEIARSAGLHYVFTGNVSDREHQSTYCPRCERMVIERDGYRLGAVHLRDGRCEYCDAPIAGRFDPAPGDWGGRRQPVRIARYARRTTSPPTVEKEPDMTPQPAKPSPIAAERPTLTDEQESQVFRAAAARVVAAVMSQPAQSMQAVLADVAEMPLYGVFVSLKRSGQLRSCCGFLGQSLPLGEAVDRASVRAAKDDPRFPPISPSELAHLDMEVWLLWGLEPVEAKGKDRVAAVTIGRHGLQIARGAARGLLLPGVAVEHRWDAKTFLEQVCVKAGLPSDAWLADDTQLATFDGYAIHGKIPAEAIDEEIIAGAPTRGEVAALAEFCRTNLVAMLQGATPNYYMPGGFDGSVCGLALSVGEPGRTGLQCSKVSLRPPMPLQSTLFTLAQGAARALAAQRIDLQTMQTLPVGLAVLVDPAMHGSAAKPELKGIDTKRRGVLVMAPSRLACVYDVEQTADELLRQAIEAGEFPDPAVARVFSVAVVSTEPKMTFAQAPQPQAGPDVRPPGVAGMFYPGQAEQIDRQLDAMFAETPSKREPWPGVMVPHAGWTYSGELAAKVFGRVEIPEQVIVFCPAHRGGGSEWAVAPHATWSLPGREVASDPELARRLADAVDGLQLDAAAHQQEHAIEVQLPLLARAAPHAKVVGVAIGGGGLSSLLKFGEQLAGALREMSPRPLLVISSDMNHFDDDDETRRLDRLALDAMETLDPEKLYDTVRRNRISMCGMMPAVIVMEALRRLDQLTRCELVGYATSADAAGDTTRVVGYAGMLLG